MNSRICLTLFAVCLIVAAAAAAKFADAPAATAVSPGDKLRATAEKGSISVFDLASGKEVFRIALKEETITALAFSPDGKHLVAGGKEKKVHCFETGSGKLVRVVELPAAIVSIGFSPDGKTMSVLDAEKTVRVLDATTGKEISSFKAD